MLLSIGIFIALGNPLAAQSKTHSKKLEKVKKKKNKKKKKGKKAAQYPGKIEQTATPEVKGNPTKKTRKTSGKNYQDRIGGGKAPRGTKGTNYAGKGKQKSIEKSKGTRHRGQPVPTEQKIAGNPTKKQKTSGSKYQQRIGVDGPPKRTKGTNYAGGSKPKTVNSSKGTNYRGDKVPVETNRVKGNPTKKVDKKGKGYQERVGQQGPPSGTQGTRFAGKGRPKSIKGGSDGTTYSGQSTAGSTSTAGGRTTIYGERGRNNKKSGAPEIKQREQGARWQGNLKGNKSIGGTPGTQHRGNIKGNKAIAGTPGTQHQGNLKGSKAIKGTPGTRFKGNMKAPNREVYDYGGDWAGDMKLKKVKPDTRASTYAIKGYRAKEIGQPEGTTFRGSLRGSKRIVSWDGADFQGHLKVKRNQKVKTEGTKYAGALKVKPNAKVKTPGTNFAGNLRVKPNAKVKTPGTTFAGHYKVKTNKRVKTEGVDFRGNHLTTTRFFRNRESRRKSREQQLFAGNYKVRRTKGKDLHPSATYSGGRLKDPNKRDDFSRKWKLLVAKTQKNADQPKHLKHKGKKPKYDPKEREIWNN